MHTDSADSNSGVEQVTPIADAEANALKLRRDGLSVAQLILRYFIYAVVVVSGMFVGLVVALIISALLGWLPVSC